MLYERHTLSLCVATVQTSLSTRIQSSDTIFVGSLNVDALSRDPKGTTSRGLVLTMIRMTRLEPSNIDDGKALESFRFFIQKRLSIPEGYRCSRLTSREPHSPGTGL